jgi:hypothetical protein
MNQAVTLLQSRQECLAEPCPHLEYEKFRNGSSKEIPDLSGRLLPIPAQETLGIDP